jgi:hypothetical protein
MLQVNLTISHSEADRPSASRTVAKCVSSFMEEPLEHITVFDSYDSVIMANLVKTKLDAYGVPCFLTGEHFVSLYPIRNDIFPGVRLYIFERDRDRVKEVLMEEDSPDNAGPISEF